MSINKVIIDVVTKGTEKATQNLGGVATKIAGIAGAYLSAQGLVSGIQASLDAYGKQELAEKKLSTALGFTSQKLLNQASALQQVSIFGDEATIAQMAFLASIGMTEDRIRTVIPVAMDLAEATGMSLESAVRNTAKTYSGLAGELGELVPQLRELTAEELKAGGAVAVMSQLFAGSASASADTYSGRVTQLWNDLGDLSEEIGEALMPIMEDLIPLIKDTAKFWNEFLNGAKDTDPILATTKKALGKVFTAIKILIPPLQIVSLIWNKVFSDDSAENISKYEKRLDDLNNTLAQQEIRLEETKNKHGMFSLEAEQVQTGIDRTTESINNLNEAVYFPDANMDIDPNFISPLLDPNKQPEIQAGAKATAKVVEDAETSKRRSMEQTAISIGQSSDNIANAIRDTIKMYVQSAIAGMLAKEIQDKGLLGLISGAIGASAVNLAFDTLIPRFAEDGMNEVVTEPTMIIAGENGAEQVNITPLDGTGEAGSGINLYFNSPVTNAEFVRDVIIPEINNAKRLGLA